MSAEAKQVDIQDARAGMGSAQASGAPIRQTARTRCHRAHREEERSVIPLVGLCRRCALERRSCGQLGIPASGDVRRDDDGVLRRHRLWQDDAVAPASHGSPNKAIANPDAFAINTAMQRCLVKAIALHGIGLYIYAGEDLPPGSDARGDEMQRVDTKLVSDQWLSSAPRWNWTLPRNYRAGCVLGSFAGRTDQALYITVGDAMLPQ